MNIYGYWVLLLSFDENSGGHPHKIYSLNTGSNILFFIFAESNWREHSFRSRPIFPESSWQPF